MPQPKGAIRAPTEDYEKLVNFLEAMNGRPFTAAQAVSETGVKMEVAGTFLLRNVRLKNLSRTGSHGNGLNDGYRYSVVRMPRLIVSKGLVASKVWDILCTNRRLLRECQIFRLVNEGRKVPFSRGAVHNVVFRLFKKRVVRRVKSKYMLKKNRKHRPIITA